MEVIVPAAGLSTRFPDMKPKYLLYDYKHKLMLYNAIKPYLTKNIPVTIGILKEHDTKYDASLFLSHEFGESVRVVVLDEPTRGPADTVYQILQKASIDGEFLVKDCDSFFEHEITEGNYICVSNISEHEILKKLSSKSFVICNEQEIVVNIIEKKVVSDTFCVGGYKFNSSKEYMNAFEEIQKYAGEIFVSDVIGQMLDSKIIFTKKIVSDYIDVGTAQDWFEYNDKPVIFCDIDGTLIKAQSRVGKNSYSTPAIPLEKNVKKLLELQEKGAQIIFTTSRPSEYGEETGKMLYELGFRDFNMLMGLLNSKRILINDFNKSNPYPRAISINLFRDEDNLDNYL